ncbi:unnamed protein product [Paramecium octaurelia]|uniref:Uncharacterized protein n=1 Tax=Paramecium octaurelia TaxID=43137 RepID=A0A8S1WRC4_PAROT|nr:unnamed protein product [Paramecium octaurelia]
MQLEIQLQNEQNMMELQGLLKQTPKYQTLLPKLLFSFIII